LARSPSAGAETEPCPPHPGPAYSIPHRCCFPYGPTPSRFNFLPGGGGDPEAGRRRSLLPCCGLFFPLARSRSRPPAARPRPRAPAYVFRKYPAGTAAVRNHALRPARSFAYSPVLTLSWRLRLVFAPRTAHPHSTLPVLGFHRRASARRGRPDRPNCALLKPASPFAAFTRARAPSPRTG
jgi:hypothetical protein